MSEALLRKIRQLRSEIQSIHYQTNCCLEEVEAFVNEKVISSLTGSVDPNLLIAIKDTGLSTRIRNALFDYCNIKYIGDLVTYDPIQLKRTPNLGQISFMQIENLVKSMNLKLGMKIIYWPLGDIK